MWDFMYSWAGMAVMGVLLIALIGLFIFLRMRPPE